MVKYLAHDQERALQHTVSVHSMTGEGLIQSEWEQTDWEWEWFLNW